MPRRGPTTHSGKIYHEDTEKGFIYIPLKHRSNSEGESETSISSESACSEGEEVSSNQNDQRALILFQIPSTLLPNSYHKAPTPPCSPPPPPPAPPLGIDMVVSMKLPNFRGIGNEDTEKKKIVTDVVWQDQQVNNDNIKKA